MTHASCPSTVETAYEQMPLQVPGRLEAENYDIEGFSDSSDTNQGGAYRSNEAVDVKSISGGFAVGYMTSGEWLEYTLYVETEGEYDVTIRSGAVDSGRTISITQCGESLVDEFTAPRVAAWDEFKTWSAGQIHLTPGLQKIRITVGDSNDMDLDWIQIGPYDGVIDDSDPDPGPGPVVTEVIDPPSNFTQFAGGGRGNIDHVTYNASAVGRDLEATVYTPPDYDPNQQYPVLYLLHGIGGDEWEWQNHAGAGFNNIMDNLHNDGLITPMIVVMPDGNALRGSGDDFGSFGAFEGALIENLVPYIEANYPALPNRDDRALAGLSMGGGQAATFGLRNPDVFGWVAGFSSAPNLNTSPTNFEAMRSLNAIFLSCGTSDSLLSFSTSLHDHLDDNNVPHLWKLYQGGGHDMGVWNQSLYSFARLIFQ